MKILGFDVGKKYLGVAIAQIVTRQANPLTTLRITNSCIIEQQITELLNLWQPAGLVVGVSHDLLTGKPQDSTKLSLNFIEFLRRFSQIPIYRIDETLTTWQAKSELKLIGKRRYSKQQLLEINARAASVLLQDWLEQADL